MKAIGQSVPIIFTVAALISTGFVVNVNSQEIEDHVNQLISSCGDLAQDSIDIRDNPLATQDFLDRMKEQLLQCDKAFSYFENQCQTDPSKIYCANPDLNNNTILMIFRS